MGLFGGKKTITEEAKILRIWRDESPGAMKYYGWFVLFEGKEGRFKIALSRSQAKKWVDFWSEGDVMVVEHKGERIISCQQSQRTRWSVGLAQRTEHRSNLD